MGVDFTGNIEQVTSLYDIPYTFYRKGIFTMQDVASYLNRFGPMYIIELYGRKFIYQDRGRYESFISEDGIVYEDKIPEQLGIDVMGLRFSDIIDMYFNEEETLNESTDKNKKFLTNVMGMDFTGNIEQVTSTYDVPMEFDNNISSEAIKYYLNKFGPMYLFELDGKKFLYQDQDHGDFFIDQNGYYYNDEIARVLGIDIMGLRFSDIIDMYFNEEEPINENVDKKKRLFTKMLGEDLINSIQKITSAKELPIGFLRHFGTSTIQTYIDTYGSLYYFVLDGEPFIYKDRISPKGEEYEMYINDKGESFFSGQIPNRLGLSDVGLEVSDVIDAFHNEEDDVITEDEDKMLRNKAQRRMGFIDQHVNELERDDVCKYWYKDEVDDYVFSSMKNVVEQVCDQIGSYDLYDDIYEYLVDNGYQSQFRDFFIDTHDNYC